MNTHNSKTIGANTTGFKTILVHVDSTSRSQTRTQVAIELAKIFNSHLIGLGSSGLPAAFMLQRETSIGEFVTSPMLVQRRENITEALQEFDQLVATRHIASRETRLVDDETEVALCRSAPYCDLIVVSQVYKNLSATYEHADIAQYVVLHSGRPVLILPPEWTTPKIGKRILIAWDGSATATRAITDALPLLADADTVEIIVFSSNSHDKDKSTHPDIDLEHYLTRHGVRLLISTGAVLSHGAVGEAILDYATHIDVDLLVMGGYGHTRFREFLLGSATRSVLATMTIPVLMSN